MSVGLGLLHKFIKSDLTPSFFNEHGINEDNFISDEKKVLNCILKHFTNYGKAPDIKTIRAETEVNLPDFPDEPIEYWINKIEKRRKSQLLLQTAQKVIEDVAEGDVDGAHKKFKSLSSDLKSKEAPRGFTAKDLMLMDFPEPKWAIPMILPEGLNLLGGKPKQGKSIFALNVCIEVAFGGKALREIDVEKGSALYLALEDTPRRLQDRMINMLGVRRAPDNLHLYTECPRMDEGGLDFLEQKIKEIPDLRLVVIDTLAKFRPANSGKNSSYDVDYQHVAAIKALADKHSVSILLIHHLRKMQAEDVMDTFSGTLGLTGAADGLLALIRRTGQADAELYVNGRDIEAATYALRFDPGPMTWELLGDARNVQSTKQKQQIFDALKESVVPLSPKEIAEITGLKAIYIKKNLPQLCKDSNIKKVGHGKYIFIDIK